MSDSIQSQTAKYGVDISDFAAKMKEINAAYKAQESVLEDLTGKHVEFNKKGQAIAVTMKGIIDGNKDSTASFKLVRKAVLDTTTGITEYVKQWKLMSATISGNTEASRAAKQESDRKVIQQKRDIEMYKQDVKEFQDSVKAKERTAQEALDKIANQKKIQEKRDYEMYKEDVKAYQAANKAKEASDNQYEQNQKEKRTWGDKVRNQAAAIATGMAIFTGLSVGVDSFQTSIGDAAELERKISEIRTLSQDNQLTTEEWTKGVRKLADTYGTDLKDAAESVYQTLSNQIAKGRDTFIFINEAQRFAATTMISTTEAVQLLSSGINAYGLSSKDAKVVGAEFFKMIELGRIRADEIATSMGTILPMAHELGLNMSQVGASMSAMTNQGVTAQNALTYLRNLMLALVKPSQEMKKNFEAWGVSSGEVAIKTFGFTGVLEKLDEIGQRGGLTELTKSLRNIRSLQGELLLSGSGLEKYKGYYESFLNKDSTYGSGKELSMESAGKTMQIELQKIKDIMVLDFGKPLLDMFIKVTNQFGGFANVFKAGTDFIIAATTAWFAYKTAVFLASEGLVGLGYFVEGLTIRMTELGLVMLENPITAIATGIALVTAAITYMYLKSDSAEQLATARAEKIAEIQDKLEQSSITRYSKEDERAKETVDKQYSYIYSTLANIRGKYHEMLEGVKGDILAINDSLKESMTQYTNDLDSIIGDTKGKLSELKAMIKETEGKIRDFYEKRDYTEFEQSILTKSFKEKGTGELGFSDKVKEKSLDLYKQAQQLFQSGKYTEAQELYHKSETTLEEALKLLDSAQKNFAKGLEKGNYYDPKKKTTEAQEQALYQKDYNTAKEREKTIDDQILQNLKEQLKVEKDQQALQAAKLKGYDDLKRDIRKDYAEALKIDITAKDSPDEVTHKLDRLKTIRESLDEKFTSGLGDVSLDASINIISKLQEKEDVLKRIGQLKIRETAIDQARKEAEKTQASSEKERLKLISERVELEKQLNAYIAQVKVDFSTDKNNWENAPERTLDNRDALDQGELSKNLGLSKINTLLTTIDEKSNLTTKINGLKELVLLFNKLDENSRPRDKGIFDNLTGLLNQQGPKQLSNDLNSVLHKIDDLKENVTEQTKMAKDLEDMYRGVFQQNTTNALKSNAQQLQSFKETFEQVKQILQDAKDFNFKVNLQNTAAHDDNDEAYAPSFNNQIVAQNNMSGVQASSQGSYVHNNSFGSINVTLNGGQNTQATAREIALAIRREIDRGTVPSLG